MTYAGCGREYEVDRAAVVRGDWQRRCPACHPEPAGPDARDDDPPEAA